ncbi:MAG: helix-turn-helix transcriptional regulator [Chthonomonas sp.]|nr:helix-turn-helix transcriptional regulator [Chthonomonas sp.]
MSRIPAARWVTRAELEPQLEVAREAIVSKLSQALTNYHLACLANLSEDHFVRLFRATYGVAPAKYRSIMRMRRAKELVNQGLRASQAARELGYRSLPTFSRMYRQAHGASPTKGNSAE